MATPISSLGNGVFSSIPKRHGRMDPWGKPAVFATKEEPNPGSRRLAWTWPGRGWVCEEGHFPRRGIVEHWTLTLIFEKKICTPISLENDAHFLSLYLEIDQAQQHNDGSDKSCRTESDRLLNHYCFPNFQDQKTICASGPPGHSSRSSRIGFLQLERGRRLITRGPQVRSWII